MFKVALPLLLCILSQEPDPNAFPVLPSGHVLIIDPPSTPPLISSARVVLRDGFRADLNVVIRNVAAEPLDRIELTVLVQDAEGQLTTSDTLAIPLPDLPVASQDTREVDMPLPILRQTDFVSTAVTLTSALGKTSEYRTFREDAGKAFEVPDVSVLTKGDSPLQFSDLALTRTPEGLPVELKYVVHNDSPQNVAGFTVALLLFSAERHLRYQRDTTSTGLMPSGAKQPMIATLVGAAQISNCRVVVALRRAVVGDKVWTAKVDPGEAAALLLPSPKWPAPMVRK
jgi:hypothetical protein